MHGAGVAALMLLALCTLMATSAWRRRSFALQAIGRIAAHRLAAQISKAQPPAGSRKYGEAPAQPKYELIGSMSREAHADIVRDAVQFDQFQEPGTPRIAGYAQDRAFVTRAAVRHMARKGPVGLKGGGARP